MYTWYLRDSVSLYYVDFHVVVSFFFKHVACHIERRTGKLVWFSVNHISNPIAIVNLHVKTQIDDSRPGDQNYLRLHSSHSPMIKD
jgi:hypothetical protein